jgi:hypothetical protein
MRREMGSSVEPMPFSSHRQKQGEWLQPKPTDARVGPSDVTQKNFRETLDRTKIKSNKL